ncbi:glycerophosphodiester phosphodiesterase [Tessaracoccus sp. OS52]|uniref:glycerophosphodiester phosphodiesterase n=1 Tax=Tessaracoccus sp. OS52 TaxID=2886691 RepID=UPI001D11ADE7|nr:glycerophosphodiester phosphodiesterase [Tessaracoccus sp. OS52]MCC2592904.1 glycerophosphodiester phosphodiesterase [Tessaracoccus sp. OS52]
MASMQASFLAPRFTPMAHRGGALLPENLGIENTLEAFANAVDLGFEYLETDVHATRDGHLVAFHDANLARVTDTEAEISDLTLAELREFKVGGRASIPTLEELFDAFPGCLFNLDLKAGDAVEPLARVIRRHDMVARVCVGSFSTARLRRFRRLLPGVATSASPVGVAAAVLGVLGRRPFGVPRLFQVPLTHQFGPVRVRIVTPERVRAIHAAGSKIHVWTIDDPLVMHQLIDWGVDGLITDRPDLLKGVLRDRGMWSTRN